MLQQVRDLMEGNLREGLFYYGSPFVDRAKSVSDLPFHTKDLEAAKFAVLSSGEWDLVPGMGVHPDVWFHIPTLISEQRVITDEVKEAGRISLAARSKNGPKPTWVQLNGQPTSGAVSEVAKRCHQAIMAHTIAATGETISPHIVQAVSGSLSTYYLPSAGFVELSHAQVASVTYCSQRAVRRAVAILSAAGLWGTVKGNGQQKSRYYPLFVDKGEEAFRALLEA